MNLCLEESLKVYFGYNEFRPYQKEIIAGCLNRKDVLAILPTGAGKSICYQLPALLLDGLAVVISPLISLMQDQVVSLAKNNVSAAFLNSSLPYDEIRSVMENLSNYKLLYVAPERFSNPEFLECLQRVSVSLFAIDEAHCISQWGHSFRTDYRQLSCLKRTFPTAPIIALTATATRDVEADICSQLSLQEPIVIRASFDRPNLALRIHSKNNPDSQLLAFLKKHSGASGIVYAATRKTVDETYALLQKEGFKAGKYHAGLSDSERASAQHAFIYEECPIIVATVAFGMGIHKPDIRFIVHMDMPRSIEQYYQEVGRAGRDGMPSECLMLYSPKEAKIYDRFSEQIEDSKVRRATRAKTEKMAALCSGHSCRRKSLLRYFGEEYLQSNCEGCDICLGEDDLVDETLSAQKILSCVYRLQRPFGINYVIDVLRGSKTKAILERGHDRLSTFRLMSECSEEDLRNLIHALIDKGYLERSNGEYPVLQWSALSRSAVRGEIKIMLRKKTSSARSVRSKANLIDYDKALFDQLSRLRSSFALATKVPAFVIFPNRTLIEMAQKLPATQEALLQINGVSLAKFKKYGGAFLQAICDYTERN